MRFAYFSRDRKYTLRKACVRTTMYSKSLKGSLTRFEVEHMLNNRMVRFSFILPRENKRRKLSVVGQKTVTIINTGAAFMGARDWDEETSINL